tara:strand:+ start:21624 stop:21914 length:291 start_codon:yes stop_codon:yes gene_type:complete
MEHRSEHKITNEYLKLIKDSMALGDEYIYKEMLINMIRNSNLEQLHDMFELTKIDPNSEEFKNELMINRCPITREYLLSIRNQDVIVYKVFINKDK